MQLSEFTYIFLALCVPFFAFIIKSTEPKKGFSILFSAVIAMNIFLYMNQFSYIGAFFLGMYLNLFKRSEKLYLLLLSFGSVESLVVMLCEMCVYFLVGTHQAGLLSRWSRVFFGLSRSLSR